MSIWGIFCSEIKYKSVFEYFDYFLLGDKIPKAQGMKFQPDPFLIHLSQTTSFFPPSWENAWNKIIPSYRHVPWTLCVIQDLLCLWTILIGGLGVGNWAHFFQIFLTTSNTIKMLQTFLFFFSTNQLTITVLVCFGEHLLDLKMKLCRSKFFFSRVFWEKMNKVWDWKASAKCEIGNWKKGIFWIWKWKWN